MAVTSGLASAAERILKEYHAQVSLVEKGRLEFAWLDGKRRGKTTGARD